LGLEAAFGFLRGLAGGEKSVSEAMRRGMPRTSIVDAAESEDWRCVLESHVLRRLVGGSDERDYTNTYFNPPFGVIAYVVRPCILTRS
jgi:hypothetical protein